MTTPNEALKTARRYVARHRRDSIVVGLLEDADGYLVRLQLRPEFIDPEHGPIIELGPGPLTVDKLTGRVVDHGSAAGASERWDSMVPVTITEETR